MDNVVDDLGQEECDGQGNGMRKDNTRNALGLNVKIEGKCNEYERQNDNFV